MSKTAVITGATSGIGAAYAKRLAADGYDLIITGRRKEIVQKLADDLIKQHNVKVKVIIAELSNDSDIQKVIDAMKAAENVDLLINNAGYSGDYEHFIDVKVADCEQVIKVHQIVPIRLISAIVPEMVKRGSGAIINVSSGGAYLPLPGFATYQASKAFLKMFSEDLYMELKDKGIKVQALCPGPTITDFYRDYTEETLKIFSRNFKLMSPVAVVDYSLKCIKKNKPICIPGFSYKAMCRLLPLMPRNLYYKMASRMMS